MDNCKFFLFYENSFFFVEQQNIACYNLLKLKKTEDEE